MKTPKTAALASISLGLRNWWSSSQWAYLGGGIIIVACTVVYWPARHGGFVLDDDLLLTRNQLVQAPDGLYRIWFTKQACDYWPVTNTTLWLEWRLWGMNPTGYHITNVVLHILDALLVWLVLQKLHIPGAFFAALLFAVHPVNVESVAWIAQRKNVLAMLFFLLSILSWFKSESEYETNKRSGRATGHVFHGARWYWFSLAMFAVAMLSKGSVAILPIVLLLIVWWQRRRITRNDVLHCAPFFAVAVALTCVDVWFQIQGSSEIIRNASFVQRILGAGAVVWFYLYKAVWPTNLAFVYPQWEIDGANILWWLPLLGLLTVTAALLWLWRFRERPWIRPVLLAWSLFCVLLLPVMGFTDVGFMKYSLVADHYQHLAILSVVAFVAATLTLACEHFRASATRATLTAAGMVVVLLALLARQQASLYVDAIALYSDTIEKNPASWLAHNNLGNALAEAHRTKEALAQFEVTLAIKPDSALTHNNLAMRLVDLGQLPEAISHFEQALKIQPNYADAHNHLATTLMSAGRASEAIEHFHMALVCEPRFAEAHNNLGSLLLKMGRLSEAVKEFQQALELKADYFEAHNNLAIVYSKAGALTEAIEQYERGLRLRPDSAETHNNLGNALMKAGQAGKAIEHYHTACQLKPDYAQAYVNLAVAESRAGRAAEAASSAQIALKLARVQGQAALIAQLEKWLELRGDTRSASIPSVSDVPAELR